MREKNEKNVSETEKAFAAALFLLNVLIIAVICGTLWLLQSLFARNGPFGGIVRGDFLP